MGTVINMYLMDGGLDGAKRLRIPNFSGYVTHYPKKEGGLPTGASPKTCIFILRKGWDVYVGWGIDWLGQGTVGSKIEEQELKQKWDSVTFIETDDREFMQPQTVIVLVNQLKRSFLLTNMCDVVNTQIVDVDVTQEMSSQVEDFLNRLQPLLGLVGYTFNSVDESAEEVLPIKGGTEPVNPHEQAEEEIEEERDLQPIEYNPNTTDGKCYYIVKDMFTLKKGLVDAQGRIGMGGRFVILKGSKVARKTGKDIDHRTDTMVRANECKTPLEAKEYVLGTKNVENVEWVSSYGESLADMELFTLPEDSIKIMIQLEDLGVKAEGYLLPDSSFLLLAGSKRSTTLPATFTKYNEFVERKDFKNNIGKVDPNTNTTRCHIYFRNVAAATIFLTLRASRHQDKWRTEDGVDLETILAMRSN